MPVHGIGRVGGAAAPALAAAPTPSEALGLASVLTFIKSGDMTAAMTHFEKLAPETKYRVFGETWRICGRPRPESKNPAIKALASADFGQDAFYGRVAEDGKKREATPNQIRLAVELCAIDLILCETVEKLLRGTMASDSPQFAKLIGELPAGLQKRIETKLRELFPTLPSTDTLAMILRKPSLMGVMKRSAIQAIADAWNTMRTEIGKKAEELEELSLELPADVLRDRQIAIFKAACFVAYPLLGIHKFPVEPNEAHATNAQTYAADLLASNPEIASVLVTLDPSLVTALDRPIIPAMPAAVTPVLIMDVQQAQIDAMRATLPIERTIKGIQVATTDKALREALKDFEKITRVQQWKIFEEMWRVCGRARPESTDEGKRSVSHPYFGENVFLEVPSDDGINRSATSEQRTVALELHRTVMHLEAMKELIQAGKTTDQVVLLRVMNGGLKAQLEAQLRSILGKPATDRYNYFRDNAVTPLQRRQAVEAVLNNYRDMRTTIEVLCLEYEELMVANTGRERKIAIIQEILKAAYPFMGSSEKLKLRDAFHGENELDYAKALLRDNGRSVLATLALVEPSLVFEVLEAPRAADPHMSVLMPARPRAAPAGAGHLHHSIICRGRLERARVDGRFNPARSVFTHDGAFHQVLSGAVCRTTDFASAAVVSVGASGLGREMIVFNSQLGKSPRLEEAYRSFCALHINAKNPSIEEVFANIAKFVHTEVFPKGQDQLYNFFGKWETTHPEMNNYVVEEGAIGAARAPIIPIDDFIEKKWGVCRHQALVACYFISRLMKERPDLVPAGGRVFQVRDLVMMGGSHVWAWYKHPDGTIHHTDPMWIRSHVFHPERPLSPTVTAGYTESTLRRNIERFTQ